MANIYVRSTDGSNADNGSTWALAKASLAGADGIDAAGDSIYVSQSHAESTAGAVTLTFAGTPASPTKIICGNDAADPPTAVATTATVTTTSGGSLTIGGSLYCYGITFTSDSASTYCNGAASGVVQEYEQCSIRTTNTGSSGTVNFGTSNNYAPSLRLVNTTLKLNAAAQAFGIYCNALIEGGSAIAGAAQPNYYFTLSPSDRTHGRLLVSGFDFSALSSSMVLANGAAIGIGTMVFRNCKLPSSWSGTLLTGTIPGPGARYEMHNCDSGDTNYRLWVEDYAGSIKHETTIVRSGGASDGTTAVSWKMVSSANAEYPHLRLVSPERAVWNETTGSSVTATIEIVTDNVTLKDDECWLEVMYLGTSGFPLGTWITDCKANVLASAANQATSTETWTTTGLTTPVKQKLSVTFTPQEKGAIHWRVVLCKASTTVYVDPKLTVA